MTTTAPPEPLSTPQDLVRHLKTLATRSSRSRAEQALVAQALTHPWHGVQVVAARILAQTGTAAISLLRDWLDAHADNTMLRQVAHTLLARLITADDLPWIWERYLAHRQRHLLFLIAALMRFPIPAVAEQLAADGRAGAIDALLVLTAIPAPAYRRAAVQLLADPDQPERAFLQRLLERGPLPWAQTLLAGWTPPA